MAQAQASGGGVQLSGRLFVRSCVCHPDQLLREGEHLFSLLVEGLMQIFDAGFVRALLAMRAWLWRAELALARVKTGERLRFFALRADLFFYG